MLTTIKSQFQKVTCNFQSKT